MIFALRGATWWRVYAHLKGNAGLSTLGLDMVLSVVFGFLGGRWLDGRFETAPYLTMAGFFFGVLAALRFFLRAKQRLEKQTEEDGFDASRLDRPARYALDSTRRGSRGRRRR